MNYNAAPQHSSEYAGKKKDHYHNPDGSFSFTKSQAEKRKKPKMTKKLESVEKKAAPQMKYSAPMQMESAKQEKYNLLHDNPVAKHASGGSWMSKHSKSALRMGHSPAEMGHESPAKNLGHGMKSMTDKSASKAEKKAHSQHHAKQRMMSK